jgi:hypothetical protein
MRAGRVFGCVHCGAPIVLGLDALVEVASGLEHRCARRPVSCYVPCPRCPDHRPVTVLADGTVEDAPGRPHACAAKASWPALAKLAS